MTSMSDYEATRLYGDAAGHMAQAGQFQGEAGGQEAYGDITAGKGGNVPDSPFGSAEVNREVADNPGVITQPDDVEQTETGLFPVVVSPYVGHAYEGRETGDVGK